VEEVSGLAEVQRLADEAEQAMEMEEDEWDEEGEGELL
jgi:ubiquitin-like modifier-activating enzyme ATG7